MKNEAISAILDYLCMEARNSMHTILGFMELSAEAPVDPAQLASATIGRASADQLLRLIDDLRALLAEGPPAPCAVEDFDLSCFLNEIVDVLNAASGRRRRRISVDAPVDPLGIRQNRRDVEQVLTRVLGAAAKLAQGSELYVKLARHGRNLRILVNTRDTNLSARLMEWLTSPLEGVSLQRPGDIPYGVSVMVAAKTLRALGGLAESIADAAGHCSVAIDLPSRSKIEDGADASSGSKNITDALSVLVAEDCDESFFLTELMLQDENVQRARDGYDALQTVQKRRFDLVLMDIHMPGMDGYSAIRGIRDWETQTGNARTPLVVLSSDDLETQRRLAAESGCSGFLRKPLRLIDLQGLIGHLKQSRRFVV